MWDSQYKHYKKIIDYINDHRDIYHADIRFGTLSDYFDEVNARMKAFYEEVSRKEDIGLDETILVSSAETTGTVDFYGEVSGGEDMGLNETIMVSSTETTGTIDIASSEDGTGSGEKLQEVLGAAGVAGGERDAEGRDAEVGVSTPGQVPVPQEWISLAEGVGMSVEGSGEETETRMRESE